MKRFIFLAVLAAGMITTGTALAQQVTGTWSGRAKIGPISLRVVFHIEKEGEGYSATMDTPDQGARGIPVSAISFARDTLRLSAASISLTYTGILRGDTLEGSFTQMGQTFSLDLTRGEIVLNRPQEPRGPFPYLVEEVRFNNPSVGITLAGTLTMPAEGGHGDLIVSRREGVPAVILLTGSGAQNRDEEIFGHKPFLVLADHLTRRGIAVLRFDDRGVGESGGDPSAATSADFATDAAAALDWLRVRQEIDPEKIGLAGHSEGGLIAFIAAANHPEKVAFVISMAGPGVKGEDISVMQIEDIVLARGMSAEVARAAADRQRHDLETLYGLAPELVEANLDSLASLMVPGFALLSDDAKNNARAQIRGSNSPWARFFMAHDPAGDLAGVRCPVLALGGSKDIQVRSSVNLAAIGAGLEKGGNTAVTTIEYPGLNHLFQTAETGAVEEYSRIEETFSPRAMEDIADWILSITR